MGNHFVKTTDEETAKRLIELGFNLIESPKLTGASYWKFINDGSKFDFSESDMKVSFDNKLFI